MWGRLKLHAFSTATFYEQNWSNSVLGSSTPSQITRYTLSQKAGWVPESVWTFWRRENSTAPAEKQTALLPAVV